MIETETTKQRRLLLLLPHSLSFSLSLKPKMNQIDDGRTLSPLLDQAPENVLESVLHFLTSRHDRNAASLVYKSWYHAEALTRTELFIKNCYVVSPHRASTQFPRVWSVTINGKPCFADFDLMPLNWGSTSPLRPPHSPKLTTHSSTNSTSNTCRLKRLPSDHESKIGNKGHISTKN